MPIFNHHPFFNSEQLAHLRQTFVLTCSDLSIDLGHPERRNRVALLIMQMAGDGELDGEVLRRRAVIHFTNTETSKRRWAGQAPEAARPDVVGDVARSERCLRKYWGRRGSMRRGKCKPTRAGPGQVGRGETRSRERQRPA